MLYICIQNLIFFWTNKGGRARELRLSGSSMCAEVPKAASAKEQKEMEDKSD